MDLWPGNPIRVNVFINVSAKTNILFLMESSNLLCCCAFSSLRERQAGILRVCTSTFLQLRLENQKETWVRCSYLTAVGSIHRVGSVSFRHMLCVEACGWKQCKVYVWFYNSCFYSGYHFPPLSLSLFCLSRTMLWCDMLSPSFFTPVWFREFKQDVYFQFTRRSLNEVMRWRAKTKTYFHQRICLLLVIDGWDGLSSENDK